MQGLLKLGRTGGVKPVRRVERNGETHLTPMLITNGHTDLLQSKSTVYWQDSTGVLKSLSIPLIEEHFSALAAVKFLFVWKYPHNVDEEACPIAASVKPLPARERDIYGFDVEMAIEPVNFLQISESERQRLIYHELSHVSVDTEEDLRPVRDQNGRIKIIMVPHDLHYKGFREETRLFGVAPGYKGTIEFLHRNLKNGRG